MGRVLVTRRLTEGGTDPLLHDGHEVIEPEQTPLSPDELIRYAGEVDGIVCHLTDRMDRAVFEAGQAGKLRVVANAAVGYDNIDVPSAQDCGISVCNTPGVLDDTTADLAFLLILAAARQSTQAEADLREGRWTGWGFDTHLARDVYGTTLGLVGYGRIGRAVAQRAAGFDMEVLHTTRHDTGVPGYVAFSARTVAALGHRQPPCASQRDHSAFDRRTGAGADEANGRPRQHRTRTRCRRERVWSDALEAGSLYAAGLDVFDGEPAVNPRLLNAPRATLLPHIGSATIGTRTRMARLACQGVSDVLAGRTPPNLIVPTIPAT